MVDKIPQLGPYFLEDSPTSYNKNHPLMLALNGNPPQQSDVSGWYDFLHLQVD